MSDQQYTMTCNECRALSNFTLDYIITQNNEEILDKYMLELCARDKEINELKICNVFVSLLPFMWSYFQKFIGSYEICEMISSCN